METIKDLVAALAQAIKDGRTVKITADEISITGPDEGSVTSLDITVE